MRATARPSSCRPVSTRWRSARRWPSCCSPRDARAAERALDYVHGFTLASDVSVPHPDYYRPAVRFKCRDGLPTGPAIVPASALGDVDAIGLTVRIDGEVAVSASTATLIRPVRELIADVTAFMSFDAGDVLLLGVAGARARAGSTIEISAAGFGTLRHTLIAEEAR